ncbi:MAG: hypothetical protein SGBAC_005469 [Bacillariaceae sp.]
MEHSSQNPDNAMSSSADCGSDIEPLSLDADTTSCMTESQIDTLAPLFAVNTTRRRSDVTTAQRHCKPSPVRSCPSHEHPRQVEIRKRRKKRFWMIVKVLMRYLEKKDSYLYGKARNTLGDCAKRHVMNDEQCINLIDSVQRELKRIVGTVYWDRAERHVAKHLLTNPKENPQIEEKKLQKQRFWMLVKVLMRYLENKDSELYKKARATLKDCEKRNVKKEERFTNLVECVQRELTKVVGMRYWERAERHVAKHLTAKAEEAAIAKEESSCGSPMELHVKHRVDPSALKGAFKPPK